MSTTPVPTVDKGLSHAGQVFIGVVVTICFLSGLSVALRIFGRIKEFRRLHVDDYAIIFAWITCFTTVTLTSYWACVSGVGWSIHVIPYTQLVRFFKIFYGLELLYVLSVFVVKVSILLLYIRIFDTTRFKLVAYSVLAICTCWYIASTIVAIFQCLPVHGAWDIEMQLTGEAKCLDKQKLYWGVGISNLLLDVLILCLPMPVIWTLQLTKDKKIALSVIFLTGSIVCISSILRVTSIGIIENSDFTKTIDAAALWSSVEANVAVIAACLPTLGHVFVRFRKQLRSHATPTYDPERSNLNSRTPMDTLKSEGSRRKFDPYSTNIDNEMHKMSGWRSGTNEAYVEMKDGDSPTEPTTPYETSQVFITREIKSEETRARR